LVDAIAAELLADAAAGESAVGCAAIDPAAVLFEHADEIHALDAFGELVGDRLEGALEVELEAERFLARGDDVGGQVIGLDDGSGGGHDDLLDHMFELPHVSWPLVALEPR